MSTDQDSENLINRLNSGAFEPGDAPQGLGTPAYLGDDRIFQLRFDTFANFLEAPQQHQQLGDTSETTATPDMGSLRFGDVMRTLSARPGSGIPSLSSHGSLEGLYQLTSGNGTDDGLGRQGTKAPETKESKEAGKENQYHRNWDRSMRRAEQEFSAPLESFQGAGNQVGEYHDFARELSVDLTGKSVDDIWREIQDSNLSESNLSDTTVGNFLDKVGRNYLNKGFNVNNQGQTGNQAPRVKAEQYDDGPSGTLHRFNEPPKLQNESGSVRVAEKLKQEAWLEADESTQRESYDVAQQPKKEQSQQKEAQKYRRGNKRKAETQSEEDKITRQQERMMKNRESAARSRERKQRYTANLEEKLGTLTNENQRLKNELQKEQARRQNLASERQQQEHGKAQKEQPASNHNRPLTRNNLRRYNSWPPPT